MNNKVKYIFNLLKKLKTYPDFKDHAPTIISGKDTFANITDYYIPEKNGKMIGVLFINYITNLPGRLGNFDHVVSIVKAESIESVLYDNKHYKFDTTDVGSIDVKDFDSELFFRSLIRVCEYGIFNWGVPFKRYAVRAHDSNYITNIVDIDCTRDEVFTVSSYTFTASESPPIDEKSTILFYSDISIFYIPLINLYAIGNKLGVYPDALSDAVHEVLKERKIHVRPREYLNSAQRMMRLMNPYEIGQVVFNQDKKQSYISVVDNNTVNIEDDKEFKSWKEIDYNSPEVRLPDSKPIPFTNPVPDIESLF
jgi:hypothetical protein